MILLKLVPDGAMMAQVHCPYNEAAIAQFKVMPGFTWDRARRVWVAPVEAANLAAKTLVKAKIAKLRGELLEVPKPEALDGDPNQDLYQYQREGVSFLVDRVKHMGAALLADDMGLGKGAQALRTIHHFNHPGRTLIVCPAIMVQQWTEEVKRWLKADVIKIKSTYPHWKGIGVISYGTFGAVMSKPFHLEWRKRPKQTNLFEKEEWFRHAAFAERETAEDEMDALRQEDPEVEWRVVKEKHPVSLASTVILDEVHYISNHKSMRAKAVRTYFKQKRPKTVIALSGTPLTAYPKDLWNPLDLLFPTRFGTWFAFTKRYADGHYEDIEGLDKEVWNCNGASNLEELGARLSTVMLRRTKNEVQELPERQRIVLPIELAEKVRKSMIRAFADVESAKSVQSALSIAESHKIPPACELTLDLIKQDHRVLLLTTRRQTAEDIAKRLRKSGVDAPWVTGEDPAQKRRDILNKAKHAAVATIYSIETGINLTEFDVAVFVGLDWLPKTLLQTEARIHRIGQMKRVLYYYLIGLGTMDEIIRSRVIERLEQYSILMGGKEGDEENKLATSLGRKSDDELIAEIVAAVKERTG